MCSNEKYPVISDVCMKEGLWQILNCNIEEYKKAMQIDMRVQRTRRRRAARLTGAGEKVHFFASQKEGKRLEYAAARCNPLAAHRTTLKSGCLQC